MGMTHSQLNSLSPVPNLTVFVVPRMPPHARNFQRNNKAFKPFVIDAATRLRESSGCRLFFWADASLRFRRSVFDSVPEHVVRLWANQYWNRPWTVPSMYRWFGRDFASCALPQYQSGSILFDPASETWREIFRLWLGCCRDAACVIPDGTVIKGAVRRLVHTPSGVVETFGHRDDQSALTLAVASVLGGRVNLSVPFAYVQRQQGMIFKPGEVGPLTKYLQRNHRDFVGNWDPGFCCEIKRFADCEGMLSWAWW
jgi:hypothetical protein